MPSGLRGKEIDSVRGKGFIVLRGRCNAVRDEELIVVAREEFLVGREKVSTVVEGGRELAVVPKEEFVLPRIGKGLVVLENEFIAAVSKERFVDSGVMRGCIA